MDCKSYLYSTQLHSIFINCRTSRPNMFEIHCQENKRIYYLSSESQEEMQAWIGLIETLKHTKKEQSMKGSTDQQQQSLSSANSKSQTTPASISSGVTYNVVKSRSHTSVNPPVTSITVPRLEDTSRLRVTVTEHGVRNRMFTESGQRRDDIVIQGIDTSDDEDEMERG